MYFLYIPASCWSLDWRLHDRSVYLLRAWVSREGATVQQADNWRICKRNITRSALSYSSYIYSSTAASLPEACLHIHCGSAQGSLSPRPTQGAHNGLLRCHTSHASLHGSHQRDTGQWRVCIDSSSVRENSLLINMIESLCRDFVIDASANVGKKKEFNIVIEPQFIVESLK